VKNKPVQEKEQKQHKHIVYIDVLQQLQILTSNVDDRYGAPNWKLRAGYTQSTCYVPSVTFLPIGRRGPV